MVKESDNVDASEILDRAVLCEQMGGDLELMQILVDSFRVQRDKLVASIGEQFEQRGMEAIVEQAHKLKGSLLVLGAKLAARSARNIELLAQVGDIEQLKPAIDRLGSALIELDAELERLLREGL